MGLSRSLAEGAVARLERRAVAFVGALILAEILVAAVDPRLGALLHALLLVLLLQRGARSVLAPEQRLYWSLALVPLLRLLSLSLPLSSFPGAWRFAVVAGPMLLATVVAIRATGLGPADVGLRWRWRDAPLQAMVVVGALPLGLMEYLLLRPPPLATELSLAALWVPTTILIVATGLTEELIFRGLLQRTSSELLGPWLGPLLITCLWTALHLGLGSWPVMGLIFLTGGLFALVAGWTGSIWGVALSHGLTNVTVFLIAPLLLDPLAL